MEEKLNGINANENDVTQVSPEVTSPLMSENVTSDGENQGVEEDQDIYAELDDTDKAILRMKIEFPTMPEKEIARRLDIHPRTIMRRKQGVMFQRALAETQKSALQLIQDAQADIARRLIKIAKYGDDSLAVSAGRELLRGVLADTHNVNLGGQLNFTQDQIDKEIEGAQKILDNLVI